MRFKWKQKKSNQMKQSGGVVGTRDNGIFEWMPVKDGKWVRYIATGPLHQPTALAYSMRFCFHLVCQGRDGNYQLLYCSRSNLISGGSSHLELVSHRIISAIVRARTRTAPQCQLNRPDAPMSTRPPSDQLECQQLSTATRRSSISFVFLVFSNQ